MSENRELITDLNNINGDDVSEEVKTLLRQFQDYIVQRLDSFHVATEQQLSSYHKQWLEGQASNERRFKHLEDSDAEMLDEIKALRIALKEGDQITRDFAKDSINNQIVGFRLELANIKNDLQSSVNQAFAPVMQQLATIKEMLNSQTEIGKWRDLERDDLKKKTARHEERLDNFYVDMQDGNERMKLFITKWDKAMFGDPDNSEDLGVMRMVREAYIFATTRKKIETYLFTNPLARKVLYTILGVGGFGGLAKLIELIS